MKLIIEYKFVDEQGNVLGKGGTEISADSTRRVKNGIEALRFVLLNQLDFGGMTRTVVDGNATADGMNRLLDGNNVKDTVKYGSEKV